MEAITSAVIPVLVQQLYNSITNENQTLRGFQNEFKKLKTKLDLMTSFLADAQRLKRTHENYMTIKTILSPVRELVYDADDILLDCRIRAAYEDISMLRGYTLRGWSFRHNAIDMLNQINTRIVEMENQLRTYLSPVKQMIQNGDDGSSQRSSSIGRRTSHVLSQAKIIGLKEDTEKIIAYITRNENSRSIGVVGMGGLGKTTIAQKVFNHKEVVDHFDERIWVSVSQIFSEKDILTSMLKQLPSNDSAHVTDEMSHIQQILQNKKYLIVMDDVWNPDYDWWWLLSSYLPEGEKSNKSIIITTRNEEVATKMGATYIHHAHELNEEESWTLFGEVAFSTNKNKGKDCNFQGVGKEIVKKCNGLPLAIKTIAGLLSSKVRLHQWEEVRDNFRDELANHSSVSASLQMSYDDLPVKLKHCILSFSIYPEDCEINAEQLVYWWVGEGFVNGNEQKTAIEEAFQCLSELVNRCLVGAVKQRGYDGRVYKCKMHDMVRDLIIKMSKEETFSSFDGRNRQKPDLNSRHLGYTSAMEEKLLENNSKLRAFLLMENSVLPSLLGTGLGTIKCLRVLDLSQNEQESIGADDLLRWIKYQKRLAYLNLRRVGGLKDLPAWIRKRQNLQILVIRECNNLRRLPTSITTLQNLIVLDVENCPLENLPRGLGKLTKLQVLSGFKLGCPGDGARLRDLKGLKELRELGIKITKKDDMVDEEKDILSQLKMLKVLSIDTKDCEQKQVVLVNKLVPPPSLRELFLRSYEGDTTPYWVSPSCLPELLYLYIDHAQLTGVSKNFWVSNGKPWKIEGLCFKHLLRFKVEWKDIYNNMNYLRYVEVSHCQGLQSFPCDVDNYDIWVEEDFEHKLQNQKGKVSSEASTAEAETESQECLSS